MNTPTRCTTLLSVFVVIPLLGACATSAQQGVGMAVGGAVGALKLAYCKNFESKSDVQCMAEATVAGVAAYIAGSLYGETIDERRAKFADKLDYYDAESVRMAQLSSELEATRVALAPRIRAARAEREQLEQATADSEGLRARVVASAESLGRSKTEIDDQIASAKRELDLQEDQLSIAKLEAPGTPVVGDLEREIALLEDEIASLADVSGELAALSSTTL